MTFLNYPFDSSAPKWQSSSGTTEWTYTRKVLLLLSALDTTSWIHIFDVIYQF
jgi:hypothetical protein